MRKGVLLSTAIVAFFLYEGRANGSDDCFKGEAGDPSSYLAGTLRTQTDTAIIQFMYDIKPEDEVSLQLLDRGEAVDSITLASLPVPIKNAIEQEIIKSKEPLVGRILELEENKSCLENKLSTLEKNEKELRVRVLKIEAKNRLAA